MARSLFVIIFEGRTGSSELLARLNSHPLIQAYPEILAPTCSLGADPVGKWASIRDVFTRLRDGLEINSWLAEYSKVGGSSESLPVRGIKTRLNEASDLVWYEKAGRRQNFYAVEPAQFIPLIQEFNVKLIRLRRKNVVKHAVSWLRAVHLSNSRDNLWNIRRGQPALEAININPDFLVYTIRWLLNSQRRHDEAYAAFTHRKMMINYEDIMLEGDPEWQNRILRFLEVYSMPLVEFHQKLTDDGLTSSIINYGEIAKRVESIGLGDCLQ